MILQYLPTDTIIIDEIKLEFNQQRTYVRERLRDYKEDNQIISFGNDEETVNQRRDIYTNLNSNKSFFFLGYDANDLLNEVEVHYCDSIKVFNTQFDFNFSLDSVASELSRYSLITYRKESEYFFQGLKVVIIGKSQMGGEGNTLGYFYCASDVSHLNE